MISHWRAALPRSTGVSVSFGPRKGSREAPSALQSAPGRGARQVAGPAPLREHPNDQPSKKLSLMSAFALPREIPSEAAKRQRGKERFRPGGHRSTMGVAGPEPAMAGASAGSPIVPRARRAYALTAPPNLNGKKALTLKREAPTIWELQTAMAASEQVEAPTVRKLPVAPRTWGRPHSTAVESAALAESEGNMSVDCDGESRGGGSSSSWPRVRKQRTGVRNSMSLWEVSEALDGNAPQHPAVLPSPDTLDAHTLADLGDDLSFVDNMFFSHAPAPAPVSAPDDSMGMAALGALMIAPAARWMADVTPPAPF